MTHCGSVTETWKPGKRFPGFQDSQVSRFPSFPRNLGKPRKPGNLGTWKPRKPGNLGNYVAPPQSPRTPRCRGAPTLGQVKHFDRGSSGITGSWIFRKQKCQEKLQQPPFADPDIPHVRKLIPLLSPCPPLGCAYPPRTPPPLERVQHAGLLSFVPAHRGGPLEPPAVRRSADICASPEPNPDPRNLYLD